MQHETGTAEHPAQERRERRGHLAELGEDERLLLLGCDDLAQLAQAGPFPAVVLGPGAVTEPLRRVVTDLLEAHEERQHHTSAPDPLGVPELFGQLFHGLLVSGLLC
jgi:hypothetical protein